MRDIFTMRDDARELDLANRVVPASDWLASVTTRPATAIESAAAWPTFDGRTTTCIRGCGTRLTVGDGGFVCRGCVLAYGGQDS